MSKERELLESCLDELQYHEVPCHELVIKIKELLAQPDQFKPDWASYRQGLEDGIEKTETKQAAVAWVYERQNGDFTERTLSFGFEENFDGVITPLYTAPQTREPLSEATIEHYLERLGADFKWESGFERRL